MKPTYIVLAVTAKLIAPRRILDHGGHGRRRRGHGHDGRGLDVHDGSPPPVCSLHPLKRDEQVVILERTHCG